MHPKAKANVSQTVGINLESLSLPSQSQPYQQTQTAGVGRGRQRYLEINTTLTAPIAMEIPSGGRPMKYLTMGEQPASECHQLFLRATNVLPCLCQGCPLLPPFTSVLSHLMTHAMEQEEREEEKNKRCC